LCWPAGVKKKVGVEQEKVGHVRLANKCLWLDRASLRFFVHPPWSQAVNFDAPITLCACSAQKGPQTKKRVHMKFPIAVELFTQTFLIGSTNRHDVTSLYKNLVKIKKTNFLRAAIQEPKFCVDRKQAMSVAMGKVLASVQKISFLSNPAS
jgi:hypothetical protein